jgi:hypothetical protein
MVPPGYGTRHNVTVLVANQTTPMPTLATFSYAPPNITSVFPTSMSGPTTVRMRGSAACRL